jgi:hypothetical protein
MHLVDEGLDGSNVRLNRPESRVGGVAYPSASAPLGTALSDFAGRNPSEIPSRTQSVSAFLPGKVSMGAPFLRRISLRVCHPTSESSPNKKENGDKPLKSLSPLTLRQAQRAVSVSIALCPLMSSVLATPSEILTQSFRKRSLLSAILADVPVILPPGSPARFLRILFDSPFGAVLGSTRLHRRGRCAYPSLRTMNRGL